ncbi:MAG: SDR family NAD(P)-dependent oxidoreductase [Holophagaceae bacterium]|nr:SDR family NAD(P)-dependent oxidoreductase [Holophagaceae bacterium]
MPEPTAPTKVWFITGCSSGLGRVLVQELLAAGHRVAATARTPDSLRDLDPGDPARFLALPLDVTDDESIQAAVAAALARFGRLDVLVNNAGYGVVGALEEIPEGEIRRIFDTNVFGLLETTRAVLPTLRSQGSGWILNISSIAGIAATPGFGVYNATKFAVEGFSEALALDVGKLGIRVHIIEPGPFRTDFAGRSLVNPPPMAAYAATVGPTRRYVTDIDGRQKGDPVRAARAMIRLVEEGSDALRIPMGKAAVDRLRVKLRQVTRELEAGEAAALAMDFPE